MMTRGIDPTPQNLARLAGISLELAGRWLKLRSARVHARELACVCEKLNFRMHWMITGQGRPNRRHLYTTLEEEALGVVESLTNKELRSWIRTGKHMVKS